MINIIIILKVLITYYKVYNNKQYKIIIKFNQLMIIIQLTLNLT